MIRMEDQKYYEPPRITAAIIGWLLRDNWDTALGDYEEYYNELAASQGEFKAKWWYRGQMLRLLPDQLFEKTFWGFIMLKNYMLLGFRNLRKNKVASLINIIGLSAAIGSTVALFLFMQEIRTLDGFHEKGANIFLIGHTVERDGKEALIGTAPVPLGPALAADFPQIERAVRFVSQPASVRAVRNTFRETISFADVGFFEMLTFPLAQGQQTALVNPRAMVISAKMAEKYFRDEDPMGKSLVVTFDNGSVLSFVVRGVAAPFPSSARFTFDFVVGYEQQQAAGLADIDDWGAFTEATFVELKQPEDNVLIERQLDRYLQVQNEANASWQVGSYFLDNIKAPDLMRAWATEDRAISATPVWEMVGIGLVALLVLLITCFNYITISLGAAARRLKEIGIRKTAGAEKQQLIKQFLTENLVLCMIALLLGLVLATAFVIPYMNSLIHMQLQIDFTNNPGFWVFLVGLLGFIALVSGAYPAFYISSFQPVEILRGKLKLTEKKRLNRVLTTVQFVLTIATICISLFLANLDNALNNKDWGYNKEAVLVIPGLNQAQYVQVQQEVLQLPDVAGLARSQHHIGASFREIMVQADGVEREAAFFGVGPGYLEAMGIETISGRAFNKVFAADHGASVVINQTFAVQQGWEDAKGQQVHIDDQSYAVVGIVDDFLLHPLAGKIHPVVFGISDEVQHNYLILHVGHEAMSEVIGRLKTIWQREFPEVSLEYIPQAKVFREYDLTMNVFSQFIGYLAIFALFISCMGLFGMATQRASQRIKEIGIRKAMGASAGQIVILVNRSFLIMLGISTLIATPICYAGLSMLVHLSGIEFEMSVAPFVVANVLVFSLAILTLLMQTRKLVRVNPAEVLQYG